MAHPKYAPAGATACGERQDASQFIGCSRHMVHCYNNFLARRAQLGLIDLKGVEGRREQQ